MKNFILYILILCSLTIHGQSDNNCLGIKITKKNSNFKIKKKMDVYSRSGFYIYPNYCYKLEFSDNVVTLGRITNINNNIISITNAYNEEVAKKMNIIYDTLYYNFSEIKSIILISGDLYNPENRTIMLINYNLEITKLACSSLPYKICLQSGKILDCFPFLTNNSIALIYEENGELKILDSKY